MQTVGVARSCNLCVMSGAERGGKGSIFRKREARGARHETKAGCFSFPFPFRTLDLRSLPASSLFGVCHDAPITRSRWRESRAHRDRPATDHAESMRITFQYHIITTGHHGSAKLPTTWKPRFIRSFVRCYLPLNKFKRFYFGVYFIIWTLLIQLCNCSWYRDQGHCNGSF